VAGTCHLLVCGPERVAHPPWASVIPAIEWTLLTRHKTAQDKAEQSGIGAVVGEVELRKVSS
jgi:hypothetical protein